MQPRPSALGLGWAVANHLARDSNVLTPLAFSPAPRFPVPVVGSKLLVGRETRDAVTPNRTRGERDSGAPHVGGMQVGDAQRRVPEHDGVPLWVEVTEGVLGGAAVPLLIAEPAQRLRSALHVASVDDQIQVAVPAQLTPDQCVDSPAAHHENGDIGPFEGIEGLDHAPGLHRWVLVEDARQADLDPSR